MKKILFLMFVLLNFLLNAQSFCTQTFTVSGLDNDPTILTINMADLNCFGAGIPAVISLVNPQISDGNCGTNSWYGFNLNVDGVSILADVCNASFNNVDITGFTTLNILSQDNDNFASGDNVTITIDVQVVYTDPGENTCFEPYNVTFSNVSGNAVDITWQDYDTNINNWNYVVQPFGNGAPILGSQANTNTLNISGLNPGLTYEFYVQADCGGGDLSNWAGPFTIVNTLVPNFVGDSSSLGGDCYLITPELNSQAGAVWYNNPIDMNQDFEIVFDANFGANDGNGADGMAFVLKTDANPIIGNPGEGIGYEGIVNSMAVEFDTFDNGFNNDGSSDHVAILSNGETNHTLASNLAGPVDASATGTNIEDDTFHEVKINWTAAAQTLDVFFDCSLRVSYTGDVVTNFFNNNATVFFGFTGSTGGFTNRHELCFKRISFIDSLILSDKVICVGDSVTDVDVTYQNATGYSWSPTTGVSDTTIPNPVFTPTDDTIYTVTTTDDCGVSFTDSFAIIVSNPTLVTLSSNSPILTGSNAIFSLAGTPNATVTYTIDNGITMETVVLDASGHISVTVPDVDQELTILLTSIEINSCINILSDTATVLIDVEIIPSGFSPNNDGLNDTFDIGFLANSIKVYNRHGISVYEKAGYRNEWGGSSKAGDELPTGTYYYVIEVTQRSPLTGWVYINREN